MALAQPKIAAPQQQQQQPRISNQRTARTAAQSRYVKNTRAHYGGLLKTGAVLGLALIALMTYVMLTSSMTSLSYADSKAHRERDHLQIETARLDDQLAIMRSDERLARIAAKLGMKEPQQFASIQLTPPKAAPSQWWLAFISPRQRAH